MDKKFVIYYYNNAKHNIHTHLNRIPITFKTRKYENQTEIKTCNIIDNDYYQ